MIGDSSWISILLWPVNNWKVSCKVGRAKRKKKNGTNESAKHENLKETDFIMTMTIGLEIDYKLFVERKGNEVGGKKANNFLIAFPRFYILSPARWRDWRQLQLTAIYDWPCTSCLRGKSEVMPICESK